MLSLCNSRSLGRKISILHRYARMYRAQALREFSLQGSGRVQSVLNVADAGGGSQENLACRLLDAMTCLQGEND